jgi:hypothetical protein
MSFRSTDAGQRLNQPPHPLPGHQSPDPLIRGRGSSSFFKMVGLIGAYLNPEIQERLCRLADKLDRVAASRSARQISRRLDRRLPGGVVPRAIMRVLTEAVEPLHVQAIHEAVEQLLGHSIARSTIKNCLARQARSDGRLVRLARGRYRLIGE